MHDTLMDGGGTGKWVEKGHVGEWAGWLNGGRLSE